MRHDATCRLQIGDLGAAFDARTVNLSVGGVFVEANRVLDPGAQVEMKVNLRDGGAPLDARGEVVWVRPAAEEGAPAGMALRFLSLDDMSARRIARLVSQRAREPSGYLKRKVRIRLPGLPAALRAVARDLSEQGVMLEAELPWLKLGSAVTTEIAPGRVRTGRMRWVGVDVASTGVARLRISVDFVSGAANAGVAPESTPPEASAPAIDETDQIRPRKRRWWPWALFVGLSAAAAGGALWFDRAMSVPPVQPVEVHLAEPQPGPTIEPTPTVVIPKATEPQAKVPHKRARR